MFDGKCFLYIDDILILKSIIKLVVDVVCSLFEKVVPLVRWVS